MAEKDVKVLTTDMLDDLAKKAIHNYMTEIKEYGGVSSEKALYALFVKIVVSLEDHKGRVDARRVVKDFVDQLYSVP